MPIRKIKKSDFQKIKKLEKELADYEKQLDSSIKGNSGKEYFSVFKKNYKKKSFTGFIAIENKKIVGLVWGYIKNWQIYKDEKRGEIHDLIVSKNHREKGIGSALLKRIIKSFKEKGIKTILIWSYHNNKKAIKLYKKLGFDSYYTGLVKFGK